MNAKPASQPAPTDGITALAWNPRGDMLIASSWDGFVYCWKVDKPPMGHVAPAPDHINTTACPAKLNHEVPVLTCEWNGDGSKIFSGGCDNKVKICDILGSGQTVQIGQHDTPVKVMKWLPAQNILVTGGWDKTLRYWDLRQQQAAMTVPLPGRAYTLDSKNNILVVGCSERAITTYNLSSPNAVLNNMESPLKMQTRTISLMNDGSGYVVGSIEGRVGIHTYAYPTNKDKSFCFKCHRDKADVAFPVNSVDFNQLGTFSTAGGDGTISVWDIQQKSRVKQIATGSQAISCTKFSPDSTLFAFAESYDWSKGIDHFNPQATNTVYIRNISKDDIFKKK